MNLTLYRERAELLSKRSPTELTLLLRSASYPRYVAGATGALGRFYGTVGERDFVLRRVLPRKDAFEPILSGVVQPAKDGGCTVSLTLTPQPATNRACLLLCLFFVLATLLCLWQMQRTGFRASLLTPALLLTLSWLLPRSTLRSRCKAAKAEFSQFL